MGRPKSLKPKLPQKLLAVTLPPEIHRKFKLEALKIGHTMNELILEYIETFVSGKEERWTSKKIGLTRKDYEEFRDNVFAVPVEEEQEPEEEDKT